MEEKEESIKNPEKRKSEFAPLTTAPEEKNGQGVPPDVIQEKINTWVRHGGKILGLIKGATLIAGGNGVFCLVSKDQEKIEAVMKVCTAIEARRQKEKQSNLTAVPSIVKPK